MGSLSEMEKEEKDADDLMNGKSLGLAVKAGNTEKAPEPIANTQEHKPSAGELSELKNKYELLEHKYNVLKGKEYAEVPRLQAENKALKEEMVNLKKSLDVVAESKAKTPATDTSFDVFYETLKAELGDTAVDAIKQIVNGSKNNTDISPLQQKLDNYESKIIKLEAAQTKSAETVFLERLKVLVPDWENINTMGPWLTFLNDRVPNSRITYQQALDEAHSGGDYSVVAEIFNTFKSSQKGKTAVVEDPTIEDFVEPGQARPADPANAGYKKTYTQNEINKYYDNYKRGRISETNWKKLEAEIDLAHSEGRILPS